MIAEIQVAPSPPGTADDPHAHVEAAIAVIAASGMRYEVGALGTTIEGEDDAVWATLRAAHEAMLAAGAARASWPGCRSSGCSRSRAWPSS